MIGVIVLVLMLAATVLLLALLKTSKEDEPGIDFCRHCGAVWDSRHENDGCPVVGATYRTLGTDEEFAADRQREGRHGLKETVRPVSGRADW